MDKSVLKWVEGRVEEGVFASKSHAVEYALRHLMHEEKRKIM